MYTHMCTPFLEYTEIKWKSIKRIMNIGFIIPSFGWDRGKKRMKDHKYTWRLFSKYFILHSGLLVFIMLFHIANYRKLKKKTCIWSSEGIISGSQQRTEGTAGWSFEDELLKELLTKVWVIHKGYWRTQSLQGWKAITTPESLKRWKWCHQSPVNTGIVEVNTLQWGDTQQGQQS